MKKKQACCSLPCTITKWVSSLLLLVVTLAALVGVYVTHVVHAGSTIQFGSTSGSLSILAFTVALMSLLKHMACCMKPCEVCNA